MTGTRSISIYGHNLFVQFMTQAQGQWWASPATIMMQWAWTASVEVRTLRLHLRCAHAVATRRFASAATATSWLLFTMLPVRPSLTRNHNVTYVYRVLTASCFAVCKCLGSRWRLRPPATGGKKLCNSPRRHFLQDRQLFELAWYYHDRTACCHISFRGAFHGVQMAVHKKVLTSL